MHGLHTEKYVQLRSKCYQMYSLKIPTNFLTSFQSFDEVSCKSKYIKRLRVSAVISKEGKQEV